MRIVFLGTPQFAVPSLEALIRAGHQVAAVVTQPDRAKGRGNVMAESPVKISAKALGVTIHQPERVRRPEALELLGSLNAELMVVVGYGQIIPQTVIDLPEHGILNVHASLLPKYRGAAPIQWAIASGEAETGVTIMQIDAGLDTGDVLAQRSTPIGPDETAPELSLRLASDGADLLVRTIAAIEEGTAQREQQDDTQATLAPLLTKEDGRVEWHLRAEQIYNRVRGFSPWPGAFTEFRGDVLSLVSAKHCTDAMGERLEAGTISIARKRLLVGCGGGSRLELFEVQLAGRKRMTAEAFINGYRPNPGERFVSRAASQ